MKILVPVDGSENSKSALREVARRKWDDGSEVKIIHVVESPVLVTDVMGVNAELARDTHHKAVENGQEILSAAEKIIKDVTGNNLRISSEVITAQPFHSAQQEIVADAEREGADLIIMGSRGFSLWKRLMIGSVSTAVVQHAPCSVEIVRPKKLVFEQEN